METLLHVEPLTRHISAPITIGSTDYIFYGNQETPDGEQVGHKLANICLGAPLTSVDPGSTYNQLPLVKTVGLIPNYHTKGEVVTETIHYLDGQNLIPVRMKFRSGFGEGLCVSHLPSLNMIRRCISGNGDSRIIDPRSEIVESLVGTDTAEEWGMKPWARDWVESDMIPRLRDLNYTINALSVSPVERMIDNYLTELGDIPNEMSLGNVKSLWENFIPERTHLPPSYHLSSPIILPLTTVRQQIVLNNHDFRSWGRLHLNDLYQIASNPRGFEDYAEWFDDIPLTDFNVDMVCDIQGEIIFYHAHLVANRFNSLKNHRLSPVIDAQQLEEEFDGDFNIKLLETFVRCHPSISDEITDWLNSQPVKIKFIKTMSEEAAILLYRANAQGEEPPVIGVKFDMGLQFLAPMSVMEEAI